LGARTLSVSGSSLRASAFTLVNLAQPLSRRMACWRGSERAEIETNDVELAHSVPGAAISATRLAMVVHAGTHIEAPRHFFPDGKGILDYVHAGSLTAEALRAADPGIEPGDAVLLYFGWAERYTAPSYYDHPHLSPGATEYLVERKIGLLGVDLLTPDAPSADRPDGFDFPVHTLLLNEDVLIVENLGPGVRQVLGRDFVLSVAPLPIDGAEASPVAPVALVPRAGD
jgi:arylformamidase